MTSTTFPRHTALPSRDTLIAAGGVAVSMLVAIAIARHLTSGAALRGLSPWLVVHLATVIPALPLGAWIIANRKGDRRHRLLGRVWCVLMMLGALSSFALTGLMGHIGPIHLLSVAVIVGVPRAIWKAMRGDIAAHRRGMSIMAASTVLAGLFAFLPGRVMASWLFG